MTLQTLWILILIIPRVQGLFLHPSREFDVFSEAQEATSSVLRHSWLPSCSIVFVTDGSAPSTTIYKVLEDFETENNVGVFEALLQSEKNKTFLHQSTLLRYVKQIFESSRCLTLVVVGDDEEFLDSFLERVYNNGVLIWSTRVLVVTRLPYVDFRHLKETVSAVNGMVLILEETSITKRCGLYMYLPYSHRRVHVASWTQRFGLTYHTRYRMFPDKYKRLADGAHFVVSGVHFLPHVVIKKLATGDDGESTFSYTGPGVKLLNLLAANINFTYTLSNRNLESFGYLLPNGSWTGMVGMVHRKEAEFALGPLGVTYLRSRVVDYTIPVFFDYVRALGRRGSSKVDPWSFVMPFAPSVWISIFITLLLIKVIVVVFSKIEKDSPSSSSSNLFNYYRILFQQDFVDASCSWWERFIIGGWILTILILLESYSGNLMSLLAVRHIAHPYQSIRDILDDPGVTMIWNGNTAYVQYFKSVESGLFREVAESEKRGRILYYEYYSEIAPLLSTGDYVLMNPDLTMSILLTEDHMENGQCKFYMSKERYLPFSFCMIVQKDSPLRAAINRGIRGVTEGGLYWHWLAYAIPNVGSCKNPPMKITIKSSLSIENLWGMFVILIAGYVISFLILLLEFMAQHFF